MIAEGVLIDVLYVVLLAIGPEERWSAARSSLSGTFSFKGLMIVFAFSVLIISVILMIWAIIKQKRTENFLRQKVSQLTLTNNRLQKEIAAINQELLKVLGSTVDVEPPENEIPELNAQQMHALSVLSKRLQ